MAVVFADTHSRMLRYVIPRRGAVSISVDHADRPGAMASIAEALSSSDPPEQRFRACRGDPQPGTEVTASDEVKAKMWASDAAILLVMSTRDERELSENLAHECGFMQGQGKRLLPLVEDAVADRMSRHANLQGLQRARFTKEAACEAGRWINPRSGAALAELAQARRAERGLSRDGAR